MSKKNSKHIRLLFLIPPLLLLLFSGYKVISILYQSYGAQQDFSKLSNRYYQAGTNSDASEHDESGKAGGSVTILPQFNDLISQNNDIGGWIRIEGTAVDYPVMYTPDEPQKYLHKAFDGTYSIYGVPFVGAGCSLSPRSENVVIYGHHMNDGTMFATLVNYAEKSYWEKHPVIEFSTLYESHQYEIFAAVSTDIQSAESIRCYSFINSANEADFNSFIDGIHNAALYDTGVDVKYGDCLLTLSTCAYHTENGRFVLIAKELTD
ncbi:MAG: class B sortase [Oscillospiraceae bacterium]|jgi:sortase B